MRNICMKKLVSWKSAHRFSPRIVQFKNSQQLQQAGQSQAFRHNRHNQVRAASTKPALPTSWSKWDPSTKSRLLKSWIFPVKKAEPTQFVDCPLAQIYKAIGFQTINSWVSTILGLKRFLSCTPVPNGLVCDSLIEAIRWLKRLAPAPPRPTTRSLVQTILGLRRFVPRPPRQRILWYAPHPVLCPLSSDCQPPFIM